MNQGMYEDSVILGYDTVSLGKSFPTFFKLYSLQASETHYSVTWPHNNNNNNNNNNNVVCLT